MIIIKSPTDHIVAFYDPRITEKDAAGSLEDALFFLGAAEREGFIDPSDRIQYVNQLLQARNEYQGAV